MLQRSITRPAKPSSAGVSDSATSTATSTTIAPATPSAPTKGMPMASSPSRATATAVPANRTERPAVLIASTMASSGPRP
jgi:hypothetical protein